MITVYEFMFKRALPIDDGSDKTMAFCEIVQRPNSLFSLPQSHRLLLLQNIIVLPLVCIIYFNFQRMCLTIGALT